MTEPIGYLIEKSGINNGHYFIPAADYVHVEERFQHLYQPVYAHPAAQPEYLTGCLYPSEFGCQFYGKCLSVACNHYNKTECRPRMTVLAQVDGIVYPKVGT